MNNSTPTLKEEQFQERNIISVHEDFELEVCTSEVRKQIAFQIRYRAYLEAGMTEEKEAGVLTDDYDSSLNVRIFLVSHQGKPIATVRSCIYSDTYGWVPTEALNYFHRELTQQLGNKTRLLESNRFAVDPEFQGRKSLFARFLLFRAHGLNAAAHGCEYIMTSVQANHVAFYRRFLNLDPISDQPVYYDWLGADVSLLINRTEECLGAILKRGMPDYDLHDIEQFAICAHLQAVQFQGKVA